MGGAKPLVWLDEWMAVAGVRILSKRERWIGHRTYLVVRLFLRVSKYDTPTIVNAGMGDGN